MDFYLTTSASTLPRFQITWLLGSEAGNADFRPAAILDGPTFRSDTKQVGILSEHALTLTRNRPRIIGQIQYGGARKECFCEVICHKTTF